jgi:ribosome biogenesis GTPase / thiamine phosphate phosphatase
VTLFEPHRADDLLPARVLTEHRGSYVVRGPEGEVDATVSGRLRHLATDAEAFPAVGDWVACQAADGSAVIHVVLPRRSRFARPSRGEIPGAQVVAANVDLVLVVAALDHDFNLRRLERYIALAWSSGAEPAIVLNKADVCDDAAARVADVHAVAPGVPVRVISALEGRGMESLAPLLEAGRTVALLGSSGVGKSTIVNSLLGWQRQQVNEVRADDQRGRHTTTNRELLLTPSGALVIDTPGMRSVGMWDADEGIEAAFADVETLASACRFSDCAHRSEPGCAVQSAIASGQLPAARLHSWRKLGRELASIERRRGDPQVRAAHRQRWRAIHKATRKHMRLKYGAD